MITFKIYGNLEDKRLVEIGLGIWDFGLREGYGFLRKPIFIVRFAHSLRLTNEMAIFSLICAVSPHPYTIGKSRSENNLQHANLYLYLLR
jgi:hypothetical protein